MKLTVLGCYGPYPPAGGACSGYLLQEGIYSVLIDCGNGVLSRLQEHISYRDLDAVFLSHLHADHISDIMIMRYGLEIAYNRKTRSEPLPLYAPDEPVSEFERLPYKNAYTVKPLAAENEYRVGPFAIQTGIGVHAVPSIAMRIASPSGTIVYTGDTEYHPELEKFATGADLFLCEANYLDQDIENNLPNHLSASQAARVAAEAGVKKLLLTHHHPERDLLESLSEARKYYPGVESAQEGETYIIKPA